VGLIGHLLMVVILLATIVVCSIVSLVLAMHYVNRAVTSIVAAEVTRMITQFRAACPIYSGILGRVNDLEAKQSAQTDAVEVVRKKLFDTITEMNATKPRRGTELGEVVSGNDGFSPTWRTR